MEEEKNMRICPVERAGSLDNSLRRLLQNPRKILGPYIKNGMTVLDLGCGPGFFTVEIARMLNNTGKVIAADIQDGMLEKLREKIKGTELEKRIELHKIPTDSLEINEEVDFILAFYMIHEVPDQDKLLNGLKYILKPGGNIFIVEPKFHVSKKSFEEMIKRIQNIGFETEYTTKVFFSRAIMISKKDN